METRGFPSGLAKLMNGFVRILFVCIAIYLTLLSGFSTSAITADEHTFIFNDSIWANLAFEAGFLILFLLTMVWIGGKGHHADVKNIRKAEMALRAVIVVAASLLVLTTQRLPNADQRQVYETVEAIIRHDPAPFEPGGYLEMYPYQSGIIYFQYLLARLFGMNNYMLFQCLNVLCFIWILHSILEIERLSGWDPISGPVTLAFLLLFLPFLLYVNFIYGTIIGLALTLEAFRLLLLFGRSEGKRRWLYAVLSVLAMLAAVMVKNNYMIFLIAMIIYLVREGLRQRRLLYVPVCVGMALVLALNGPLAHALIERASGQRLTKGVNSWAWVALGLSENEEKYNGWWNHYTNGTYRANNFDHDAQGIVAREEVARRLGDFAREPRKAIKFFAGKNASQWNNPDFEAYCFNLFMIENEHLVPTRLVYRLFTVEWGARFHAYLNRLHFILLVGVCLFLLLSPFGEDSAFFYELTVIGGMLFHTVWEAKGQYTFTYFLLLIPLSAEGYCRLAAGVSGPMERKRLALRPKNRVAVLLTVLALFTIGSRRFSLLNNIFMPDNALGAYQEYLAANTYVRIPEGTYVIRARATGEPLGAVGEAAQCLHGEEQTPSVFELRYQDPTDAITLTGTSNGLCLISPGEYPREKQSVLLAESSGSKDESWALVQGDAENEYYIVFRSGYALTLQADGTSVALGKMAFEDTQCWVLEPASR